MYEFFEHTADLGFRVRAADLPALMTDAARALFAALVEDPATIRPRERRQVCVDADVHDELLHDWLAELLYLYDVDHLLLTQFDVTVADNHLSATVHGEPFDGERHELAAEIKAITYHGLSVEQDAAGWTAEVIVDV